MYILRRVDGICGSGQSGTVKNGGVENAGVDIYRHGMARVDNAGEKNVSK